MKSRIIIAVFFILSCYNLKGQESNNIEYKINIIGKWNFAHIKSENDTIINEDIKIENIAFFSNGSFTMNGNDKTKIVGKFKIDSKLLILSNTFVNGKKSEKRYQFPYMFSNSKKLILEFISELGKRKLIFTKK